MFIKIKDFSFIIGNAATASSIKEAFASAQYGCTVFVIERPYMGKDHDLWKGLSKSELGHMI